MVRKKDVTTPTACMMTAIAAALMGMLAENEGSENGGAILQQRFGLKLRLGVEAPNVNGDGSEGAATVGMGRAMQGMSGSDRCGDLG